MIVTLLLLTAAFFIGGLLGGLVCCLAAIAGEADRMTERAHCDTGAAEFNFKTFYVERRKESIEDLFGSVGLNEECEPDDGKSSHL